MQFNNNTVICKNRDHILKCYFLCCVCLKETKKGNDTELIGSNLIIIQNNQHSSRSVHNYRCPCTVQTLLQDFSRCHNLYGVFTRIMFTITWSIRKFFKKSTVNHRWNLFVVKCRFNLICKWKFSIKANVISCLCNIFFFIINVKQPVLVSESVAYLTVPDK